MDLGEGRSGLWFEYEPVVPRRLLPVSPPGTNPGFTVLYLCVYRVSQEERTKLRESVPYVKLYRYNPKHLYPKLNGYGDNGQRSLKL